MGNLLLIPGTDPNVTVFMCDITPWLASLHRLCRISHQFDTHPVTVEPVWTLNSALAPDMMSVYRCKRNHRVALVLRYPVLLAEHEGVEHLSRLQGTMNTCVPRLSSLHEDTASYMAAGPGQN